jgi:hypothetical protein
VEIIWNISEMKDYMNWNGLKWAEMVVKWANQVKEW